MLDSKKILFITTLNLASNPRLVKEIDLAILSKYEVSVICFEFNNWSKNYNKELLKRFDSVRFYIISAERRPYITWFIQSFKERFYRFAFNFFPLKLSQISQAISRRSNMIIGVLNHIKHADLVVGHNPGVLFPSLLAAKKFNCPVGFDMEDYHPGEGPNAHLKRITFDCIKKCLPLFNYVSFSSELIKNRVEDDLNIKNKNWFTLLNYFPSSDFIHPYTQSIGIIKFVWFSQNINFGRGLEGFIPLMDRLSNCELHLYGNINKHFFEKILSNRKYIILHEPIPQIQLHRELSNYDIGLALDIAIDENRDLAITNKFLAYLQSGLFIVTSNTSAHRFLLEHHPINGMCLYDSYADNYPLLNNLLSNIDNIRKNRTERFNCFLNKSWETERTSLENKWADLLH